MPSHRITRAAALATALALVAAPHLRAQDDDRGTQLRGFADVGYRSAAADGATRPGFGLGQFDLYLTSRLADRVSFLGETVFEWDDATSSFAIDVERVIVSYQATAHLRLSGGKVHTPIGYWNNAYHHGAVIQPTISRPQAVQFEDDGGVLPVHTVGVQLSGRDLGALHLGFDALVGNALGNRPEQDARNAAGSVTLAVHSQVTPDLRVGASFYQDRLAAGTATQATDSLAAPLTQGIGGAFVSWFGTHAEAVVEGHQVRDRSAGRSSTSPAWFAYAGVRATPTVVPYLVHDEVRLAANDAYFLAGRTRREIVGVRWEITATAAAKLEGRSVRMGDAARRGELAAQVAVAF